MRRLVVPLTLVAVAFLCFLIAIAVSPFEPGPVAFFWGVWDGACAPIIFVLSRFFGGKVFVETLGNDYRAGFALGLLFWPFGILSAFRKI